LKSKTTLEKEQKRNETSLIRCIGMTIETRPDYAKLKHCNQMLKLGCTRIELGIQSIYNQSLKKIKRGHTVEDSIKAMKTLKDLGFKINVHYMLGLPSSTPKNDLKGLETLFSDERFRPDMLKIYPCVVLKGTKLYELYKKKKFKPITIKQTIEVLSEFKKRVPMYLRIMRIQRDIPPRVIESGVNRTNLRQYINQKCNCIRCREVGRARKYGKPSIKIIEYKASQGKEFFISFEDKKNILFGFCRLRIPSQSLRKEITENSAIIRELHIYGPSIQIGKKGNIQHKGLGKELLKKAEEIARFHKKNKIVVISGIGVREYYRRHGYKKDGPYMSKKIL
jgi:elongator complex protein 3